MPSANEELYKFVKDRYDKAFSARQMWQTRLQHLLLLCGFLVTAVVTFLGPTTVGILADCKSPPDYIAACVAVIAFVSLLFYLAVPIGRLLTILEKVDVYVPDAEIDATLTRLRFKGEIDINETYADLASLYIDATDENTKFGANVGRTVRQAVFHLRVLAFLTLVVLLLIGTVRVGVRSNWFTGKKEQTKMPDPEKEQSPPNTAPSTVPGPAPTPPNVAPPNPGMIPPLKIKVRPITGTEEGALPTVKAVDRANA
jgi:hypothetical protein